MDHNMDLLCTENILNDNESELFGYRHQHKQQQQEQLQQHQQQQQQEQLQQHQQQQQQNKEQHRSQLLTFLLHSGVSVPPVAPPPATQAARSTESLSTSLSTSPYCSSAASSCSSTSSSSSTSSGYNSTTSVGSSTACRRSSCTCCRRSSTVTVSSSGALAIECAASSAAPAALHAASGGGTAEGKAPPQPAQQQQQQAPQSVHRTTYQQQQQQQNAYTINISNRALDYVNTATEDPTFLTDRCLENALKAEEKRPHTVATYFKTVQKDITPPMRKIVAEWMMEVCAEEKCQEEVVLLALNYMDRFLSTKPVRKTHLQILAAACLLLASKLREPSCRALSADLLVFYTDNSISKCDLIKWELYVLSRLGWDLSSVTPLDFLELLLIRLPIRSSKCPDVNVDKVRQHAQAFISLAAKEHHFSKFTASTIAASSIAAALSGLNWHLRSGQNLRHLLNLLTDLTSVDQDYLHDCMMKMELIFEEHSRKLQPFLLGAADSQQQQQQQLHHQQLQQQQQQQQLQQTHHRHHSHHALGGMSHVSAASAAASVAAAASALLPDLTQTCKMQANAQKDVQDIKF